MSNVGELVEEVFQIWFEDVFASKSAIQIFNESFILLL